jgi:MFS family permease
MRRGSNFAILLTTSLVSSLIMLDSNIVAVSLPAIARSFNATFTDIERVVSAYLLSYAALLLAGGALADLWGRKKVMMLGLIIFALSSGVCGLTNSTLLLNLARTVQGIGGSLLLTAALAIISHFVSAATTVGLNADMTAGAAKQVTSGNLMGMLIDVPDGIYRAPLQGGPAVRARTQSQSRDRAASQNSRYRRMDHSVYRDAGSFLA